ncbi:MAG TPA: hypothetical protein VJV79_30360 [Polyangiaceae bacterium]|nr:hypothetical protein [Polyangiaceae bacterium]
MKKITLFRCASVLLALLCVMHTIGGMIAQKSLGAASDVVFEQMKGVHFDFNGADCTWYGFWFGFGLTVSAFLLLSAIIAWELERVDLALWPQLRYVAWALVASHAFNTLISWRYFFAGPGIFGVVITLLLAIATQRKLRLAALHR